MLKQYIRSLHMTHQLSTELMAVALRLACRKGNASMAFYLLHEVKTLGYVTDTDTVNSVLELLGRDNQIKPMMNIAEDVQKGHYGSVSCDSTSLAQLFHVAVRQNTSLPLLRCCQFASAQHTLRKLKCDELVFLDALDVCKRKGDVSGAMVLFSLYQKVYRTIRPQAYTLLLSTYVTAATVQQDDSSVTNTTESGKNGTYTVTPLVEERLRFLVDYIVTSKLDKAQPGLADLVLRYLCINARRTNAEGQSEAARTAGVPDSADGKHWKTGLKTSATATSIAGEAAGAALPAQDQPALPSPGAYLRRVLQEYEHMPSVTAQQGYAKLVQHTADEEEVVFLRTLTTRGNTASLS